MSDSRIFAPAPSLRRRLRTRAALCAALALLVTISLPACSASEDAEPGEEGATRTAESGEQSADRAEGPEGAEGEEREKASNGRVSLSEAAFRTAGIIIEPVRAETFATASGTVEIPGEVEFDPARVAMISPRSPGRVERLLAVPGDRIGAGETVALIYSPEFITAQGDLQQAKRRADVLAGTADAEGARALLAAARRRLELLGLGAAAVANVEDGESMTLLPVAAPFAGSILEAPGVVGTAVDAGDPLFRIADLAVVNVAADVPERTLAALRVGQGAQIRLAAYPDLRFSGRVTRVIDQLDRETRTAKALVQVANTGRVLKPGMYATVSLSGLGPADVRLGASGDTVTPPMLSVPVSAVVTDGGSRYVFVEVAPRTFERREVLLAGGAGPVRPGGRVTVLTGVSPGERVVTRGAFTLKSEMAKASFAEDEG